MSDDKTEQPTAKRLREAREKGDICKSQDIPHAVSVLACSMYLIANGSNIFDLLRALVVTPMRYMHLPFRDAMSHIMPVLTDVCIQLVAPFIGVVFMSTLISLLAQTGVLFAFKAAIPKLENLNPSKWFKKVFSMKNLVELLKNIIKVSVLAFVVKVVLEKHLPHLFRMNNNGLGSMWSVMGEVMSDLLIMASGAFCVIAALDFLYQKYQYTKQHMMSKDEVKREYKESEGDPHIKGKRKQLHKEMIAQNNLQNTRKAKVLVTNPTHYAVALDYEKDKTPLPVILAKGEGYLAQRMIEVAKEEGIPIMRDVPLARALYRDGTENSYIPKDLLAPVAQVLKWVQSLENNKG